MLLYTKVAPPKVPKRRSRAGCTFCKEKKKKCDEERPQCSRCAERGLDCSYEAVRPRQRRKRDSVTSFSSSTLSRHFDRKPSCSSTRRWSRGSILSEDQHDWFRHHADDKSDLALANPCDDGPLDQTRPCTLAESNRGLSPAQGAHDVAIDFEDEDVEFVERTDVNGRNQALVHVSKPPDLAMISPCPVSSPLMEFHIPAFYEFSDRPNRRALVDHFCNQLSHLIVFREETGNPFRELVLPLTKKSSPVMNAIWALASAHLEYRGVKNQEQSIHFHNEAIQGLATMIDHDGSKADRNEMLAAIMLLVYYEVLVQRGQSNLVDGHLRGAMTIMNSFPPATDPTGIFLERAFRFYDVIAALSFGTAPLSQAPGRGCMDPLPPPGALPMNSRLGSVDTLLGMSTSLWPIIHRLSELASDKRELEKACSSGQSSPMIAVLKTEFETNSRAIERELERWQPVLPVGFDPDDAPSPETEEKKHDAATAERSRLHSTFNNAMAYRHSCFVYLFHTIYGRPRTHPSIQSHAHASLWHCLQTCSHAGPMGALLWPLFVASCEAVTDEDRGLAREAFLLVEKRQGMINIKWAWDIVQEVWRLADIEISEMEQEKELHLQQSMNADGLGGDWSVVSGADLSVGMRCGTPDLWRKVSEQMGISIVFG